MTDAEAIAFARALVASGQWWYDLGNHGRVIAADKPGAGKLGVDCQYFVDLVAIHAGFADKLGAVLPWGVPYMVDHSTLPHLPPTTPPVPGDIAVFENRHTALFTDPGHVIQAYNPARGLIETTLAEVGIQLTLILRTGLSQARAVPAIAAPPLPNPAPIFKGALHTAVASGSSGAAYTPGNPSTLVDVPAGTSLSVLELNLDGALWWVVESSGQYLGFFIRHGDPSWSVTPLGR